jgi:hypothetical protein
MHDTSRLFRLVARRSMCFRCGIRRAQIVFAPSEEDVKAYRHFCVHIRPEDFVIPICHEGMNRAQILYLVLHGLKRSLVPAGSPRRVCVPHGAESGFDPYQAYTDLTEHNVYGYIHGRMLPRGAEGDWVRAW